MPANPCTARTSKGYLCLNAASSGCFCPSHDPRNWCGARTVNGTACRRMKLTGTEHCSYHQH